MVKMMMFMMILLMIVVDVNGDVVDVIDCGDEAQRLMISVRFEFQGDKVFKLFSELMFLLRVPFLP